jgi:hypothetical protein
VTASSKPTRWREMPLLLSRAAATPRAPHERVRELYFSNPLATAAPGLAECSIGKSAAKSDRFVRANATITDLHSPIRARLSSGYQGHRCTRPGRPRRATASVAKRSRDRSQTRSAKRSSAEEVRRRAPVRPGNRTLRCGGC